MTWRCLVIVTSRNVNLVSHPISIPIFSYSAFCSWFCSPLRGPPRDIPTTNTGGKALPFHNPTPINCDPATMIRSKPSWFQPGPIPRASGYFPRFLLGSMWHLPLPTYGPEFY